MIDHISNGRFTLNIVTGWVQPEIEMFGQPMLSHEERYACAEEWLAIVKRLWTEDEHVRPRGPVLQDREGLSAAEADPASLPRDHERRRLGARPAFRGQALRPGLHRDPHRRARRMPRACAGLSHSWRARIRPRDQGLDARQHRAGRDREGGARLLQLLRPPEGRLGGGQEHGRDHLARDQPAQRSAGAASSRCRRRSSRAGAACRWSAPRSRWSMR